MSIPRTNMQILGNSPISEEAKKKFASNLNALNQRVRNGAVKVLRSEANFLQECGKNVLSVMHGTRKNPELRKSIITKQMPELSGESNIEEYHQYVNSAITTLTQYSDVQALRFFTDTEWVQIKGLEWDLQTTQNTDLIMLP